MSYTLIRQNCLDWFREQPPDSLHAVCTDPPYGIVEFSEKELEKLRAGQGGVWRIPPNLNGSLRAPLPRFTVLSSEQQKAIAQFFLEWGVEVLRAIVPGGHVMVAGHPILQHHVQGAMAEAGFEVRGAIIRIYQGFRGGDRPKNAEQEFPDVSVTPKGWHEPWMLFRKPIGEETVAANLRRWKTGGLRRLEGSKPFPEVVFSGKTPKAEERIADHPCLKPQHFLRIVVRALLPLGEGVVVDPFMGSGSTIAAATNVGYKAIGIELDQEYYRMAERAVPALARMYPGFHGQTLERPDAEPMVAKAIQEPLLF
jgi:site-specific DNA-methyltransferase (adenine-specific)